MRKWVFLLVALLLLLSPLVGGCGAKKYELTISVSPSGGGTTSPAVGTHKYEKDASVTITATPGTGYEFVNWTGDASGTTATATVIMTEDKSVSANFAKIQYTLTMAVNPAGGGTTDPAVGTHDYDTGTVVDITATAASGYGFVNWTGDVADVDDATTTVTMDAAQTVTANFALTVTHTLTMAVDPALSGTTTPAVGTPSYPEGTVVDITAVAATGWRFDHWSGNVTGTNASTSVTMSADKTATANFIQVFILTMAKVGNGTTTPAVGTHTYDVGTPVDIMANPATGWQFDSWTGNVTDPDSAATTVTMTAAKTVTANFSQIPYTLTMAVDPVDSGTTDPAVGDHEILGGTVEDITASPADASWYFVNWTGAVANANSEATTVTVSGNMTVTANFTQTSHTLTMAVTGSGSTIPTLGGHIYGEGRVVTITATPAVG